MVHRLMEEAEEQEDRAEKSEALAKSLKKGVGALEDEVRQMAEECLEQDAVAVEHFPTTCCQQ